ncbi:MAG: lipase maturation factor family protein [Sandaracinaceae bacterium]|nr:lipase maturation factor family protein [Sandaracinaceae bacterium]
MTVAAFDDRLLGALGRLPAAALPAPSRARRAVSWAVFALVLFLSVDPLMNLFRYRQIVNGSFDRLHIVNTYGAFGSVNRVRHEIVLEGTNDDPDAPSARWLAYELPCKPGDPMRAPCVRAPYHHRLDWQMWFASLSDQEDEPWIVHLVAKLPRGRSRRDGALRERSVPRRAAAPRARELLPLLLREPGRAGLVAARARG